MEIKQKVLNNEEFDWEYYDYAGELEQEWRLSQLRYTDKELLEIYPAVKSVITDKLTELGEERNLLVSEIKGKLIEIRDKVRDEFSQWFCREWIKAVEGQQLLQIDRQIERFRRLQFIAQGKMIKGQITDDHIHHALSIPIQNIIPNEAKFRRSGKTLMGLCPLHEEKHPSFFIYPDTNTCWCFGCNQGGDTINFVRLLFGYSFKEAVNYLIGNK